MPLSRTRSIASRAPTHEKIAGFIRENPQRCIILTGNLDAWIMPIIEKLGMKRHCMCSKAKACEDHLLGIASMLEGYAEYYSAELSMKTQRGQKENALKRKNNGGVTPLGYAIGKEGVLEINPITAPIIMGIFKRYDDGAMMNEIADELNARGLKTTKGNPFRTESINLILKNRKSIGEYGYKDVIIPNGIPVIADRDTFERVQERLKLNSRAPARKKANEE